MARSDFLVRMKADTKDYDKNVAAAKKQLDGFANANFTAGGQMKQMSAMLVSTAAKFVSFGAAIKAIQGALEVMKSALMTSESFVDEWGRTVAASQSVYQSFLQSLNTGDYTGFITRINEVISKAREAYDALDELQTRGGIVSSERLRLQSRQTELKAIIRREGKDSAAGQAAQAELRLLEQRITKAYGTEEKLNYNAFKKLVEQKLGEAGINLNKKSMDFLMRSFSDESVYDVLKKNAKGTLHTASGIDLRNTEQKLLDLFTDEWRGENKRYLDAAFSARNAAASSLLGDARYINGGAGGGGGKSGGGGKGGTTALTGFNVKDVAGLGFADAVTKELKKVKFDPLGEMLAGQGLDSKMYDFIENLKNNLSQADVGTAFYSSISGRLADAEGLRNLIAEAITDGVDLASVNMDGIKMKLFNAEDIDEELQALVDYINNEKGGVPIKLNFETGAVEGGGKKGYSMEDFEKDQKNTQQVVSGLQSVASGLQQMGIKLPEGVQNVLNGIQGAMSVIQGVMSIIQVFQTSTVTTQIASQTANTSALIALTAAVGANTAALGMNSAFNLIPFAKGGVVRAANGFVPGQAWANDRVPALLNSGELVLNRAQAGVLGSLLSDGKGKMEEGRGLPYVSGEQIYLGLSNYLRRTGRGEIVTAR